MEIEGKVAVVSGGGSGIGRAAVRGSNPLGSTAEFAQLAGFVFSTPNQTVNGCTLTRFLESGGGQVGVKCSFPVRAASQASCSRRSSED